MTYVIVNTATRCKVAHPRTRKDTYDTISAAKAAMTRLVTINMNDYLAGMGRVARIDYEIMEQSAYRAQVPMREVINLMTGKPVQEPADTPWTCSVASETYWSS